jgi:hypothetical protein
MTDVQSLPDLMAAPVHPSAVCSPERSAGGLPDYFFLPAFVSAVSVSSATLN